MKRFALLAVVLSCVLSLSASKGNADDTLQMKYIERYSALAVEEMYRTGVPASITLAQGLLESGYGLSELAVKGNNHFGIKCHNTWTGKKVYHDDDAKGECFRKYDSPEESFRDHSDFLRYRDRYRFLFDLELSDYEGWAHGLRKAGYATDPQYPQKLIRLINEYALHQYDKVPEGGMLEEGDVVVKEIPQSPAQIEQARPLTQGQREVFRFALSRQMYSLNGVPFVYAVEGETYESIARSYNLFTRELLRFNDLKESVPLQPGTVVYLQAKKKMAAVGLEKYVVDGEADLWAISQRYAVKLDRLCRMNGIRRDHVLRDGDVIVLRNK